MIAQKIVIQYNENILLRLRVLHYFALLFYIFFSSKQTNIEGTAKMQKNKENVKRLYGIFRWASECQI